jgi:hypothetical protein
MMVGRKYQTLLVIVTGLLVIWYIQKVETLLYVSLGIALAGLIIPPIATGIDWLWYKIAKVMGAVMSRVILTVFFFGILTPIALLKKLLSGKDPMQLKDPGTTTWKERNHLFTAKDIENPW